MPGTSLGADLATPPKSATMQLHQIRYFLAVCAERNFTRAARRCRVAQPSLTRAIKRLEIELGGPLFVRGAGWSSLTELGRLVRPLLAQAADCIDAANRLAGALKRPEAPTTARGRSRSARRTSRDDRFLRAL